MTNTTTTTSPPISMPSVKRLRGALRRSWQAGRTREMLARMTPREAMALERDFVTLAHPHQEPPPLCRQRQALDHLAGAGRARRRQDAAGRRVGARARERRGALRRAAPFAHRAGRRDRARRARGDGGRAGGAVAVLAARRTAGVDRIAAAAGMAERRGGLVLLGGGPRAIARAAIRRRLVRRARQVELSRRHLRHVAVRPALGAAPAPARHHHAAADPAHQAIARRPAHGGDARRDPRQRRVPRRPPSSTRCWRAMQGTRLGRQEIEARSSRTGPTRCGRGR